MPELTLLPPDSAPKDAPKPKLGENDRLEVYGLGERRALLVASRHNQEVAFKQAWLSAQEAELASSLLETIRARHLKPDEPLLIVAHATQTALLKCLEGHPIVSHIMTRPVRLGEALPPSPEGVWSREMTSGEVAVFLEELEKSYAVTLMENSGGAADLERWRLQSRLTFERALPQRGETPGHSFLVIEDDEAQQVGVLWVGLNQATKISFCYRIEVEADKRRLGYGTRLLTAWERHAAEQDATLLELNVWGKNVGAQKFYVQAGFVVESTTFRLGQQPRQEHSIVSGPA